MRIFVTGSSGQLARSLREALRSRTDVAVEFGARPDLDLADPKSVYRAISAFKPDIVVNPAAYTSVDKAESEAELAYRINEDGARSVARAAQAAGATIVHLSTDYVFDGTKTSAYDETDPTRPTTTYGKSKLAGELAVAQENPQHLILRTSWVYAPFGQNFVRTMLRLGQERERVRVVNDQRGCPTYAPDIAQAILAIAEQIQPSWQEAYAGVTHLAGPDVVSWYEFAREIFAGAAARGAPAPAVDQIATSEYPTPAKRPANSQLATDRLRSLFGVTIPPMQTSLSSCLDRIFADVGTR